MEETPLEKAIRTYHAREAAERAYKEAWTHALIDCGVRPTDLAQAIGKHPNHVSTVKNRLKKEAK